MLDVISKIIIGFGKYLMHFWVRCISNRDFRRRFNTVYQKYPEYHRSVGREIEKNHVKLWRTLRNDINLDTLRICSNISGKPSSEMVPEEVFQSDIQRTICMKQRQIQYLANKSFYDRWFKNDIFPKVFIHNIEGTFYNSQYQSITELQLLQILDEIEYPVVIKPNMDSMGGANVHFAKNREELKNLMKNRRNYVVQEMIEQDEFFAKYNRHGLNTIRVDLYRSVVTNHVHYLHAAFRMGKGGGLDNETAGGIHCFINKDGFLNGYAVDKSGTKYHKHPDTKLEFSKEKKLPAFEEMKKVAIEIARDLYIPRLISLDMCLDVDGRWRVIEINLNDITIQFAQLGGKPFFSPFTEEVIEYCKNNPWWKL